MLLSKKSSYIGATNRYFLAIARLEGEKSSVGDLFLKHAGLAWRGWRAKKYNDLEIELCART